MRFLLSFLSAALTALLVLPALRAAPQESEAVATETLSLQLKVEANSEKTLGVQVTDGSGAPVADAAVAFRLPDGQPSGVFPDGSHSAVVYTDAAGKAQAPAITWSGTPGSMPIRITAAKGSAHAGLLIDQSSQPLAAAVRGAPPKPGVVAGPAMAQSSAEPAIARSGASSAEAALNSPRDTVTPPGQISEPPSVSITSASPASVSHSHKKWIVIAALSAAAGVGAMMALRGSGGGSSTTRGAASGLSIGAPTISVGHP